MRQICPNCQQSVTIADSDAGKTVPCPSCQQPFAIPAPFTPTIFEPPPLAPPPVTPPAPVTTPVSTTAATPEPTATTPSETPSSTSPSDQTPPKGYARLCSIPLNKTVCHWLAPVCLTLVLVLTFFNWVGMYPAGYAAYTQNGWQALVADLSADPVSEKEWKMEGPINEWLRSSWWLLPYMVLLIPGVLLAWSEPLVKSGKVKLPAVVEGMLRLRPALLGACVGITLLFVLIQTAASFGIERATHNMVQEKFREARKEAKTPEEIQKVEMKVAEVTGGFHLRSTFWLKLSIGLHILALLAIVGETLLIHRGDKPAPRIGVMW